MIPKMSEAERRWREAEARRQAEREAAAKEAANKESNPAGVIGAVAGTPVAGLGINYGVEQALAPSTAAPATGVAAPAATVPAAESSVAPALASLSAPTGASASYLAAPATPAGVSANAVYTGGAPATAAPATLAGSETLAAAAPYAGAALGAYGAYEGIKEKKPLLSAAGGAVAGGSLGGPWGALIGGAVGGAAGLTADLTSGNMDNEQKNRNRLRDILAQEGISEDFNNIKFGDGTGFNLGTDEEAKYNIDFTRPGANETTGIGQVIGALLGGRDQDLSEHATGYLVNAALENAGGDPGKARAYLQEEFNRFSAKPEDAVGQLNTLRDQGAVKDYDVMRASLDSLLKGQNPNYDPTTVVPTETAPTPTEDETKKAAWDKVNESLKTSYNFKR